MKKRSISTGWIVLGVVAVAIIIIFGTVIGIKNDLNTMYHQIQNHESKVENLIHDKAVKIPDLVAIVERSSKHEKDIVQAIADARASANVISKSEDVAKLDSANANLETQIEVLNNFIVENYPEISVSDEYTGLMDEISSAQAMISIERENYIDACTRYNTKIDEFPTSIFANMFGYREVEMYEKEAEDSERGLVNFGS